MGMIRARVSDDLEKKLNETVEKVKESTPTGAEANMSTIIRGAIEDFIQRIEDEEKGLLTIKFNIAELNNEELEIVKKTFNNLAQMQEKKGQKNSLFHKQLCEIVYEAFREDIKRIK